MLPFFLLPARSTPSFPFRALRKGPETHPPTSRAEQSRAEEREGGEREERTRRDVKRTGDSARLTARRGEHDVPVGIGHPVRGGAAVGERRVAVVFGADDRDGVEGGWGVEEEEEEEEGDEGERMDHCCRLSLRKP